MAFHKLHIAMHAPGPGPRCKFFFGGLNCETIGTFQLKLELEGGNLDHWDIKPSTLSEAKDFIELTLKDGFSDEHIHLRGTLEVGTADGYIHLQRWGICTAWLVVNDDENRKIRSAYNEKKTSEEIVCPPLFLKGGTALLR